jgi:hypothetical protein
MMSILMLNESSDGEVSLLTLEEWLSPFHMQYNISCQFQCASFMILRDNLSIPRLEKSCGLVFLISCIATVGFVTLGLSYHWAILISIFFQLNYWLGVK